MFKIYAWMSALLIGTAAAVWCVYPSPAAASAVIELPDDTLTDMASDIVHGTVVGSQALMRDDGIILTKVTMMVHEWLKSSQDNQPELCVFYTRGGSIDAMTQHISGEVSPKLGMEAVVFLEPVRRYNNQLMVLGMLQGVFAVDDPPASRSDGAMRKAKRHLDGLTVHRMANEKQSDFDKAQSLDELKTIIRNKVKSSRNGESKI